MSSNSRQRTKTLIAAVEIFNACWAGRGGLCSVIFQPSNVNFLMSWSIKCSSAEFSQRQPRQLCQPARPAISCRCRNEKYKASISIFVNYSSLALHFMAVEDDTPSLLDAPLAGLHPPCAPCSILRAPCSILQAPFIPFSVQMLH